MYEHLGIERWPFDVVPRPDLCTFIAGRTQIKSDLDHLMNSWSRRDSSSIHLLWSWYGAGKTHTLYYLANHLRERSLEPSVAAHCPVYSEFPKAARGFLDLYQSLMTGLDPNYLMDTVLEALTSDQSGAFERGLFSASPDLTNALKVIVTGTEQDQNTALRWLRADPLPISQFRDIGVAQKINSPEEAIRVLSALVTVFAEAAKAQERPGTRIIWMIDEFQRIERLRQPVRDEINTGLHSAFNACPAGLTLFLSFSGHPKPNEVPSWFSQELLDRIGRTKIMVLPPMLPVEANRFVQEVLEHARGKFGEQSSKFFPFTKKSCNVIVVEVQKKEKLKPRALMHAFNAVLQEADQLIEEGQLKVVTPEFCTEVLKEYFVLRADEGGE